MSLYKDMYGIIEDFLQIKNLYNFIEKNESLIYTCNQCEKPFSNISKNNIMMYELDYFNNNLLYDNKKIKCGIQVYLMLQSIDVKLCRYKKVNKIFCGMCSMHVNKRTSMCNYADYGIANHLSLKHYNFIKLNNCLLIKDYITDSKAYIKRYSYEFGNNEDTLMVNSLFLDDKKDIIKTIVKNKKFADIKIVIQKTFNINFDYLYEYLKEKTN